MAERVNEHSPQRGDRPARRGKPLVSGGGSSGSQQRNNNNKPNYHYKAGKQRRGSSTATDEHSNTVLQQAWSCEQCTYLNPPDQIQCEICQHVPWMDTVNQEQPGESQQQQSKYLQALKGGSNSTTTTTTEEASATLPLSSSPPPAPHSSKVSSPSPISFLITVEACKALDPGTKMERPQEFHLFVTHLPGFLTAQEILQHLQKLAVPYSIRRLYVKYAHEDNLRSQKVIPVQDEIGPSQNPSILARAYVEFYPMKGMQTKLRELVQRKPGPIIPNNTIKTFCVPYFPSSVLTGEGGKPICQFARKRCWQPDCEFAHEPAGWGVTRFDGKDSSLSPSPPMPSPSSLDVPTPPPPHFLKAGLAITATCNACGLTKSFSSLDTNNNNTGPRFCDECKIRGTPKRECPLCLGMHYEDEMQIGTGLSCLNCVRTRYNAKANALFVPPHVRITTNPNNDVGKRYLPSRFELSNMLTGVGRVTMCKYDFDPITRIPTAVDVTFDEWIPNQAIAALDKIEIPKCVISIVNTTDADRVRISQLMSAGILTDKELDCLVKQLYGGG